ncbi:hypothetical protein AMELA_G00270650 [Ameiurus melas]|uniref:Uncharacterized protein n=1 Tax=Ameiurus melas TaxID=219545 RepID=A0A7J5ZNE9_AMEME|nr:hypothetical protein AMELA_G00270650 [Ameiurus melas]
MSATSSHNACCSDSIFIAIGFNLSQQRLQHSGFQLPFSGLQFNLELHACLPSAHQGHGEPGACPRSTRYKAGYTLDRMLIHCRAQSHTLVTPISLPCMSLD